MGRSSTRANKNEYQLARESAGLTMEKAADLMNGIVPKWRIEKIENGKVDPEPMDVLEMAEAYKRPQLVYHYCSRHCEIGRRNQPEVELKHLSQIALEILSTMNALDHEKDRLIEISLDGEISEDELEDFKRIRKHLRTISGTVRSLQLWVDNTIATGKISRDALDD
jgi:hypothetical protein